MVKEKEKKLTVSYRDLLTGLKKKYEVKKSKEIYDAISVLEGIEEEVKFAEKF